MPKYNIKIENKIINTESQLRIATINIMLDEFLLPERIQHLTQEIETLNPDILCLQEVNTNTSTDIVKLIAEKLNYQSTFTSKPATNKHTTVNAILTKTPNTKFKNINLKLQTETHKYPDTIHATLTHNNTETHIITTHLPWGTFNGPVRYKQAIAVNKLAETITKNNPEAIIVLAGDLNAKETETTIQYLKGQHYLNDQTGTLWTDAWEIKGTENNWTTTDPKTKLGRHTAANVNIEHPTLVPTRRIDYILIYGWVYGKKGTPLNYIRWADTPNSEGYTPSDHYGICTDIYIP